MSATKSEGYDGGGFNCVDAYDGATLSLELCDLTCECGFAVVEISAAGSAATISGCCIHDGASTGVSIHDGASATLENNNIHSNIGHCVQVAGEGTEVVLRGNCIHDGEEGGLLIVNKASATLENNTITDNDLPGVTIAGHSTATLNGNTIKLSLIHI